jgi:alanine dehydrogenase
MAAQGNISRIAASAMLQPQESLLEVKKQQQHLFIGIPRETSFQENRIPLTPESVALLVNYGHELVMETSAGQTSNYQDSDYSEAGARIAYTPEDVYKADIILKVAPPSSKEMEMLKTQQTLISILQMNMQNERFIRNLSSRKITAFAYEYIQDGSGRFPIIQAMSEIVGSSSILIAAEYLSNTFSGIGELLGGVAGIPPTRVVIIGAGTVGEFAARAAIGLGAMVKVFDNSVYRLRRIQSNLGSRIFTSTIVPETLMKELKTADVAIGALRPVNGRTPCVVSEEMVSEMKSGSVIIDVSIDSGGVFATSEVTNHSNPVFKKFGVIHYCVPNIASRVSRTASTALSNIFTPILASIGDEGGIDDMLWKNPGVRKGVYLYKGAVTNRYISEVCRTPFKDLDLIMSSRI